MFALINIQMAKIDSEVKTKFGNHKQKFMVNLFYTTSFFHNAFVEVLKPYGISPEQLNILRILRGADSAMKMNSIKELMVDKSPNLTRLSDKLISKGFIERKRSDNDRRVVYLMISTSGLNVLKKMDDDDIFAKMDFMKLITEKEAKQFSDLLDKIRG